MQALVVYLVAAMAAWANLPQDCETAKNAISCATWERYHGETIEASRERYQQVAEDIGAEAEQRPGDAKQNERVALRLLAIAYEESRFHVGVDDGTCNRSHVAARPCDGGRAWGMWQLHPEAMGGVYKGPLSGEDLVGSRPLEVRIAWDLVQRRPGAWTSWPMAARRAVEWEQRHPLP